MTGGGPADALIRDLAIVNRRGLHARAAARFVKAVEEFDATVTVEKDGQIVGGDSIMGLLMLAAAEGTTIRVSATGLEAALALTALAELLAARFGEDE